MVYAALDYFCAGVEIPPAPRLFAENGAILPETEWLLDFIVRRLVSSFNVFDFRHGALNYYRLMRPGYPAAQAPARGRKPRGWAWTMVCREWPLIRAGLDSGRPTPLGLVCARLARGFGVDEIVRGLQHDHQVLATGYELAGDGDLAIRIYDPNFPGCDAAFLCLNISDPWKPIPVEMLVDGRKKREIYCFFRTRHRPVRPPRDAYSQ
jgi:hypothetical protein